ncbi:YihY/virulence factor BrkB family protein [Streptococcus macacae]|uniref:Ribonuclease BN-like family protein n=1 Tax=Streptococcus macacae NCTC 11558 TaxID=764298 RepID=G5JWL2_9STRE|nr:YihY/virulence factor BrkB family protein [Streptococcus macacae]EHJ52220.1 ribonuclease BN-like family protein [Streptococcus macacae NCTC 11558]SUN78797.1 ribonuclease BN-like family protein [Streptococcus macacae NCTC 11558]
MKKRIDKLLASQFVQHFITYYKSSEMDLSSIAVAYYLILTIFPFLVLLANLFPYLNINTSELLSFMKNNLPEQLYENTAGIVRGIFDKPSTSLLWLAVIIGLWTMSKSLTFLQKAMNKSYGIQDHRDVILGHVVGMFSSLLVIFFLALAIILSTFGKTVLTFLYHNTYLNQNLYDVLMALTQPVTAAIFFVALAILYYILPNVKISRIRYILPGTIFTGILFFTMTSLFGTYISYAMASMENLRVFGSVTLFALMLWFTFFARVLILGAVLNASYQKQYVKEFKPRRGNIISIIQSRRDYITKKDRSKDDQ